MSRSKFTPEQNAKLAALNSRVHFTWSTAVGGGAASCIASLYEKITEKIQAKEPWAQATAGNEIMALDAVLEKAKTTTRPASTAQAVMAERDTLKEKNAALEAELAALRAQNAARSKTPPAPPTASPPEGATVSETDPREEIRALLTSAGVKFDNRLGLDKLRQLAADNNLIPDPALAGA